MTQHSNLFEPIQIGSITVPNRVLMAPLTRNRAHPDDTPHEMAIDYYRQRAAAGFILTEAAQISPQGKGYIQTPGIYNDKQVTAWQEITDAVHAAGGRILLQLWHVGRISHVSLQPDNQAPVAPSAIRAQSQVFTEAGFEDCSEPRALSKDDIKAVIADYRNAAELAKKAGFDGVEVHSANGYLLDQFLQDKSNQRTDEYGGSIENRMRLLGEVLDVVTAVWGSDRVGVRLSPLGQFNDMGDSDPLALFSAVYEMLSARHLAYLHVVEKFPGSNPSAEEKAIMDKLHGHYQGCYIANGDFDAATASEWISQGRAHAITFGRPFIANPDLPERFRQGASLNEPDDSTFYGGDRKGYTDYPFLPDATEQ